MITTATIRPGEKSFFMGKVVVLMEWSRLWRECSGRRALGLLHTQQAYDAVP